MQSSHAFVLTKDKMGVGSSPVKRKVSLNQRPNRSGCFNLVFRELVDSHCSPHDRQKLGREGKHGHKGVDASQKDCKLAITFLWIIFDGAHKANRNHSTSDYGRRSLHVVEKRGSGGRKVR